MGTILTTSLVVTPVAFMAGWLLSKALFRHMSLLRPNPHARPAQNPALDDAVHALMQGTVAPGPDASRLQAELAASRLEAEALRNELLLIRRGVAESEQTIHDLKARLSDGIPQPRSTSKSDGKEAAFRRLLAVQQERVNRRDARARELQQELQATTERLAGMERRVRSWRERIRPVIRQCRQQRSMIDELREELRQRLLVPPAATKAATVAPCKSGGGRARGRTAGKAAATTS